MEDLMDEQLIVVIAGDPDPVLVKDLEDKSIEYQVAKCGEILGDGLGTNYLYVIRDFEGDYFDKLRKHKKRIFGITAMKQSFSCVENMGLENLKYPLHNRAMVNLKIAVSKFGIEGKHRVKHHMDLVRFMGGSVRSIGDLKINYLIAYRTDGDEYRVAGTTGIPIMNPDWVDYCWQERFNENFDANDTKIIDKFRLKPFEYLYLAFVNFPKDDLQKMEELTASNGGNVVQPDNAKCTHIVVYAISGEHDPDLNIKVSNPKIYVVYEEWFWSSIQIRLRAEESSIEHKYPIDDPDQSFVSEKSIRFSYSILSPNCLNLTRGDTPDKSSSEMIFATPTASKSKKQLIIDELIETEQNYIQILNVLVNEIQSEVTNSKLLDEGQVKIIFGKLPEILKVHKQLLGELSILSTKWKESTAVTVLSSILKEYSPKLLEKYSPYVNSLESGKEIIESCRKDERFFALLKRCESRPECKRASLADLLSRPFQRPFHIRNLLQRLLDDMKAETPDRIDLDNAIKELDRTLSSINEKKRRTENHLAQFADFAKIKDLPYELISAANRINGQVNARKLRLLDGKLVACQSLILTLFILNDVLEVCKKRSLKRTPSLSRSSTKRSSTVNRTASYCGPRPNFRPPYRHIGKIDFSAIKTVENYSQCPGYDGLFILILRPQEGLDGEDVGSFRYLPFWIEDEASEEASACDHFLSSFARRLSESGYNTKEIFATRNTTPMVDLRYSEKFFSSLRRSTTMTLRFKKRFKIDSKSRETPSPLIFSKT